MSENYRLIGKIAAKDALTLSFKGATYGDSWKKRGGVGAFMMLARKWDRIENQCKGANYDIFAVIAKELKLGIAKDGLLDDIRDLRAYLLLVEAHLTESKTDKAQFCEDCKERMGDCECGGPATGYVNQDGQEMSVEFRSVGSNDSTSMPMRASEQGKMTFAGARCPHCGQQSCDCYDPPRGGLANSGSNAAALDSLPKNVFLD